MISLGNKCYCYNEDCNQKEWEKQGKEGKRQYTVVGEYWFQGGLFGIKQKHPKCPYCKKKMTVTANFSDDWDY